MSEENGYKFMEQDAATEYRALMASKLQIIDVKLPSGGVFKFKKPNTLGIIMSGELPQTAASGAVQEWVDSGAVKPLETDPETQIKIAAKAFEIRDRVIELSVSPKIVIGKADPQKDEISTDEIDNDDLTYLFKWMAAGGDASVMLAMFPKGRESGSTLGARGAKLRKTGKRARQT